MLIEDENIPFIEGDSPRAVVSTEVKLPLFQGPLDLLLFLIQKNEVDIYDIPIAHITKQYLQHLELMRELNLEVAGEFIYMAAVLIRIKARMLLPEPQIEEEEEIEDPRGELVAALIEYKKFKQVASELARRERESLLLHPRGDFSSERYGLDRDHSEAQVLPELLEAYRDALWRKTPFSDHRVDLPTLTVEDRIDHLLDLLRERPSIPLEASIEDAYEPAIMILTFVAILELARLRKITIFQSGYLDTVWISVVDQELKPERFEFAE
jgi:segregation and condensation protein A